MSTHRARSTRRGDQSVAQVTDQFLREAQYSLVSIAYPPQPTVYMFANGEFNGWISCRPFQTAPAAPGEPTGRDLRSAVAGMAWLPAARNADRLLVCWEDFTLRTHLDGPGVYMRALMVADVPLVGAHTVRWWPFTVADAEPDAAAALVLDWLPDSTGQQRGLPLPPPVVEMVGIWRANRGRLGVDATVSDATANGYRVALA